MAVENSAQPNPPLFINIRRIGSALNTFDDPQDIGDTECADAINVTFDRGYAAPRQGSFLAYTAPAGETNPLLNLFTATASDGLTYLIAAYAPNFYLRDEQNNQWIKINGAYTPSLANNALPYGYISWNNGIFDDRLYFGNGIEPTIKWQTTLDYLAVEAQPSDTTLTLVGGIRFPSTGGTIVVKGSSGEFNLTYSSRVGEVLTLTTSVGQQVSEGSAVTFAIENIAAGWTGATSFLNVTTASGDTTITLLNSSAFPASGTIAVYSNPGNPGQPTLNLTYTSNVNNVLTLTGTVGAIINLGVPVVFNNTGVAATAVGKIFTKSQGRLFIGNSYGQETNMYYSSVGNPEDFSIDGTPSGGGWYNFTEGNGPITGIVDFGIYVGVLQPNRFHRFEFVIDSTNSTKIDQVVPLISDQSGGAAYIGAYIKKNNILYYVTKTEGIFEISPVITGFQTSISLTVLSLKIQNISTELNFQNTQLATLYQKIFITAATADAIDTVLVYDTLRQYWTKFNNWAVKCWANYNDKLLFGNAQDNNIYRVFDASYTDNNNPYTASVTTKRYDFGNGAMPKTVTRIYCQGYILPSTKLYVDVMFNEAGNQQLLTYVIDGSQPGIVVTPMTTALAMVMLGVPVMGTSVLPSTTPSSDPVFSYFRCYLAIPLRYGFFNIQLRFYSIAAGDNWAVTGVAMNPRVEVLAPEAYVIPPNGVVPATKSATASGGGNSIVVPPNLKWYKETPTGAINGSNTSYTLTHSVFPLSGILVLNDQPLDEGVDYTYSGTTLTMLSAINPTNYPAGVQFTFQYQYISS